MGTAPAWPESCTSLATHPTFCAFVQTESSVKAQKTTPIIIFFLAAAALLGLAACAPVEPSQASSSHRSQDSQTLEPVEKEVPAAVNAAAPAEVLTSAAGPAASPREGMLAFEGSVFVATTELVGSLWQAAGWSIGEEPVSTDPADLPADCTLYPHAGVENQWIGRCRGYILVPQAGARDIAVMVTDEAGGTTMVQVAPPPGDRQP